MSDVKGETSVTEELSNLDHGERIVNLALF
jgi:hypothetical protein